MKVDFELICNCCFNCFLGCILELAPVFFSLLQPFATYYANKYNFNFFSKLHFWLHVVAEMC